jgi:hypothetical protein
LSLLIVSKLISTLGFCKSNLPQWLHISNILILTIRSHQVALAVQDITSAWHRVTLALQGIALTLQGIAFALHHPPFFPHQKILTKKSIDTLVQRDRLVYAIAMLVLSQDERNG